MLGKKRGFRSREERRLQRRINEVMWGQPPSAVLQYQIVIVSPLTKPLSSRRLDWTAEGGCPTWSTSQYRIQNPGGRSLTTAKARSSAIPASPSLPSSNKRPIRVTP